MATADQTSTNALELNADQALGMVSFGLMQRLAQDGQVDLPWLETNVNSTTERVERGGLVARRVSRNVWNLSRLSSSDRSENDRYDGFRRRL